MKISKFGINGSIIIVSVALSVAGIWLLFSMAGKLPASYNQISPHKTYILLIPLCLATFWFVIWRYQKDPTSAGRAFFITVFVRLIVCAVFLYPDVVVPVSATKLHAIHFFSLLFPMLFVESVLLIRILNSGSVENAKNDENQ